MSFSKTRRQKFLGEKDYSINEKGYNNRIRLSQEALASTKPKAPGADSSHRWSIASDSLELLLLNYTAGKPIEELRERFPEVIKRFDTYIENEVSPRKETPPRNVADTLEITQLEAYVYVLWLLA
uniref:PoNe immunity protein domain-containing protein n=1 Tax=Paraburkholderia bannensis TaxID=765414 RepID=UPI002AC3302C